MKKMAINPVSLLAPGTSNAILAKGSKDGEICPKDCGPVNDLDEASTYGSDSKSSAKVNNSIIETEFVSNGYGYNIKLDLSNCIVTLQDICNAPDCPPPPETILPPTQDSSAEDLKKYREQLRSMRNVIETLINAGNTQFKQVLDFLACEIQKVNSWIGADAIPNEKICFEDCADQINCYYGILNEAESSPPGEWVSKVRIDTNDDKNYFIETQHRDNAGTDNMITLDLTTCDIIHIDHTPGGDVKNTYKKAGTGSSLDDLKAYQGELVAMYKTMQDVFWGFTQYNGIFKTLYCEVAKLQELINIATVVNVEKEISALNIFPNPTSSILNVDLSTKNGTLVSVKIYDSTGKLVATLSDNEKADKNKPLTWDASKAPKGVYAVVILSPGESVTKQVIVVR